MKKQVSILTLCLLFVIACANNNNQIPNSLSSSYDGIWDGYAQTPEYITNSYGAAARAPERLYLKAEIKNGIVSGFIEDTKINGYINADNQLIGDPFYFKTEGTVSRVTGESKFMSPDRIEGIYTSEKSGVFKWYIVKAGTDKPEVTISNFQINEKEPWTGKWKVESSSAGVEYGR